MINFTAEIRNDLEYTVKLNTDDPIVLELAKISPEKTVKVIIEENKND